MAEQKVVRMNNGLGIPVLGIGTFLASGDETKTACIEAVRAGYRHIDTAQIYRNEAEVGAALRELVRDGVVTRDEIFVTSKTSARDCALRDCQSFDQDLETLERTGQVTKGVKTRCFIESRYFHRGDAYAAGIHHDVLEGLVPGMLKPIFQLFPSFMGPETVKPACVESLRRLQLDVLDLFLIHTPVGLKYTSLDDFPVTDDEGNWLKEPRDIVAAWKAMESLVDEGLVRSIGVSNFNSEQVERILENCRIKPVTNQVECHLYLQQTKLASFLSERDILLTAYSPLAAPGRPESWRDRSQHEPSLLEDDVITGLARKYNRTPAQICLRSLVQRGLVVIPKSVKAQRIRENAQIFDFVLSEEDMGVLCRLDRGLRLFGASGPWGDPADLEYPFNLEF